MNNTPERLYCDPPNSPRRRATQGVFWLSVEGLKAGLAPIFAYLTEELEEAGHMQQARARSVPSGYRVTSILFKIPQSHMSPFGLRCKMSSVHGPKHTETYRRLRALRFTLLRARRIVYAKLLMQPCSYVKP
ncbi:unnamed protein product [Protopolystoma xenopodis]|uniref:Uncharacterized protein n=1 Tax=Protopolystoma xenopodis TaxID=117903 RepID=A0A3S5CU43_9PLAT|nr:unnamed protein product [Protopolystoma xenopodis]